MFYIRACAARGVVHLLAGVLRQEVILGRFAIILAGFVVMLAVSASAQEQAERGLTMHTPGSATAGNRIALVIGNGSYRSISALDNPVPDARLMAVTLQRVGFQVTQIDDADQNTMKRGIADFGRALRQAGPNTTALFYYAGHAVQSFGNNYLLPIDSSIRDQADLDLVGVEADWVLRQLFSARIETSIVILDACRNNPFESVEGFESEGLAEMNAPTGSFIAYATAPGRVAFDGLGSNSPYTTALARAIEGQRQPIEQLFKSVRVSVLQETEGKQTPWDSSSLTTDFYFKESSADQFALTAERNLWERVSRTADALQVELFIQAYPNSVHRAEAEAMLASLEALSTARVSPSVAQPGAGASDRITFAAPLNVPDELFAGQTFAQLVQGQPRFPPFEGIPDELWKGQQCTNCHQWTQELLCEQGTFYLSNDATRSLGKDHPYGGGFKQLLKTWAGDGCP